MFIGGWRAVVFRCDHAPATRSKNIPPHMCYKRHFVAIIEFDFFAEQHLLCTQLKMGLLMSRGEDWRKGYMFAAPESMPLSALDCNAEGGWGTFSKFLVLTVDENSIYLFSAMCVAEFIRIFQWPLIRAFHPACLRFWYWCVILMSDKRLPSCMCCSSEWPRRAHLWFVKWKDRKQYKDIAQSIKGDWQYSVFFIRQEIPWKD